MRQLSGTEKWKLMGWSESKAAFLSSQGLGSQLGPLAGNSVPARMTEAVAEDVAVRVAKYDRLLKQRDLVGYVLMPPVAGLHDPSLTASFLIFIGLADSTVLVWNGCELPGMVSTYDHSGAFDAAKSRADSLGCTETERCLLLERQMGNNKACRVIFYSQELRVVPGADEMLINSVMHLPVGELAVRSLAQVERMVRTTAVAPSEWQSGTVSGTAAALSGPSKAPTASEARSWDEFLEQQDVHIIEMRSVL